MLEYCAIAVVLIALHSGESDIKLLGFKTQQVTFLCQIEIERNVNFPAHACESLKLSQHPAVGRTLKLLPSHFGAAFVSQTAFTLAPGPALVGQWVGTLVSGSGITM